MTDAPDVRTEPDRPADGTRLSILQSAAHQFANKAYSQVNLDDILDDAHVTKGALYFHFRSKHELASAVVEYRADEATDLFAQPHFQSLPALESMVEMCFVIAVDDIGSQMARAGFNLLEALGRFDGLQARLVASWVTSFAELVGRAAAEGDVDTDVDHTDVAKLVVSLYMGLRQASDLDDPTTYLHDLAAMWRLVMPGFVDARRLDYLTAFVRRRTALAIRNAVPFRADEL
ncbi:TetR/AcrR family transcriptional regulator [Mycolicibacterium sediminis]|uniref:TetR family transcriptional regulator n=1 Tax=Mycolicibacterium sediminis TaxID=1286180 RepID=A0A7I7QT78_9MYCO|nr:TetR/AcrR family transcriptional regulator [Mycolicibacterium sediminis]BBY29086.1 TetR family transcriptional regulator [Mycolicibacterium sediminis]